MDAHQLVHGCFHAGGVALQVVGEHPVAVEDLVAGRCLHTLDRCPDRLLGVTALDRLRREKMGGFRHDGCDVRDRPSLKIHSQTALGALEREPTDAFQRRCELLESLRGRIIGRGSKS